MVVNGRLLLKLLAALLMSLTTDGMIPWLEVLLDAVVVMELTDVEIPLVRPASDDDEVVELDSRPKRLDTSELSLEEDIPWLAAEVVALEAVRLLEVVSDDELDIEVVVEVKN